MRVVAVPVDPLSPADIEALEDEIARLLVDAYFAKESGGG